MNASPLAHARSFLFVPGNRPERFEKAALSGADAIVLDLEDAVAAPDKAIARGAIQATWPALVQLRTPLVVRINAADQPGFQEDLDALSKLPSLTGVMVPKAESAKTLRYVGARLPSVPILPLVESAAGLAALPEIAAAPGVLRLAVGHLDFMVDLGFQSSDDEAELVPLRFAVAMATRVHRLASAVDGVTVALQDDDRLRLDTRRSLRFGFGAKLCIHPRQVSIVHEVFEPTPKEVEWAQKVVTADAAAGGAAVQIDGRMVDLPVVMQARRVLARCTSR